jgi:hypothetical protein
MTENDDSLTAIQALLKDLELDSSSTDKVVRDLRTELGPFLRLSPEVFARIGFDVSIVAGSSGDWNLALEFAQKLVSLHDERPVLQIWRLRCLVELERYAEALALSASLRWQPSQMIHVNYLTGLAFEALGMRDQARLRFDAVHKVDATYRGVAQKRVSY